MVLKRGAITTGIITIEGTPVEEYAIQHPLNAFGNRCLRAARSQIEHRIDIHLPIGGPYQRIGVAIACYRRTGVAGVPVIKFRKIARAIVMLQEMHINADILHVRTSSQRRGAPLHRLYLAGRHRLHRALKRQLLPITSTADS